MEELKISDLLYLTELPLSIKPVIDYGSWRWRYDEAVLVVDETADYVPISTIKPILEELASGMSFWGWKGGKFHFNKNTEIHFELEKGSCADLPILSLISEDSVQYLRKNCLLDEELWTDYQWYCLIYI